MASRPRRNKAEPCAYENCGSRRFHVGDDGYTYCDRGHQQSERGTVIAEDTGEFVQLGRKSRRVDSDAESVASQSRAFSGSQALEHYVLCLQLVLRKQLRWLIDVQKLPEELELLVHDLWSLRLQTLRRKLPTENADTDPTDPLSAPQLFSSQSESESVSASASASTRHSRRKKTTQAQLQSPAPSLLELLALIYTANLLLRIPLTVADLHAWMHDGDLLYYRAAREVPLSMLERLPGRYVAMLEPQELLRAETLQKGIAKMVSLLKADFGMAMPAVNGTVVLWKWMRRLRLPVEVFAGVGRLGRVIDWGDPGGFEWEEKGNGTVGTMVLKWPEARLMVLLVMVVKLLFPFDKVERFAERETDLSASKFDWDVWMHGHSGSREVDNGSKVGIQPLTFADAFNYGPKDLATASDDELDAYLAWYENNIASDQIRERGKAGKDANFRRRLFELFPLESKDPTTPAPHAQETPGHLPETFPTGLSDRPTHPNLSTNPLHSVQSSLRPLPIRTDPVSSPKYPRPGSFYRRYRFPSDLDGPAKMFLEAAANLAAVEVDALVRALFTVEKRVQGWQEGKVATSEHKGNG